ncbi:MAG: GlsB/YeaQ/YmgE family stress response membrane protein [Cryobacterium sp.]|nr:GlsB/YeaQ/YmgE family stress response membrane protein [Oligoflexia bacterium]
MLHFIGFIILGFFAGVIARAIKPGNDRMSLMMTTLLGMAGALFAGWLGRLMNWYEPGEGAGFIVSIVGAVVVLSIAYLATNGRTRRI